MALTLVEGAKLSNDVLLEGVIETVVQESPVLQRLPFIEIVGNGLTYNRENASATAAFFAVGDAWTENTPTFSQVTASLSILGGDADVDNYLARTRNNVQDLEAAVVALKARAVQEKFDDTFINGDTGADANAFDGLDNLARASYSAYNGGPGQISRYRNPKAKVPHRKIDEAFWRKYREVKQGKELQVAVCLGGEATEISRSAPASQKTIKRKPDATSAQTARLKDDAWLQTQNENHYTLQLAVFSTRHAALAFIAKQPLTANVAVYYSRRDKHYGITYGQFSNRAAADKAKQKVPGLKPWPRRFKDIQELISP